MLYCFKNPMSFSDTNPLSHLMPIHPRTWNVASVLGEVMDYCVIGIALLLPLWLCPATLDILELNKQTLLVIVSLVAGIAWMGKALVERSFTLHRSWLYLVTLFFLVGYAIAAWFSSDHYLSIVGNVGQMQWSFMTIAAFVLLFFVMVNRYRTSGHVYDLVLWFLLGSSLSGLYGLLQMGGLFILSHWSATAVATFNSIGTVNALGVYMIIPTVIAASLTVLGCRDATCVLARNHWIATFWKYVIWASLGIGIISAVLIDFWVIWAGLLFGMVLLVVIPFLRTRKFGHPVTFMVPTVIAFISIVLLLFQTPFNVHLPSEVAPSARHTWQIAQQVLRDDPLFGSGPGTWMYDYAKYRSLNVNLSQFWNVRFERGISAFLTMLATLGLVGTTLWLLLVVSGMTKSASHLVHERNDDRWQAYLTVFVGWMTTVFIAFLYNYNIAHHAAFWFLLGLLGILVSEGSFHWNAERSPRIFTALSVAFMVLVIAGVSLAWIAGQRFVADVHYSRAVTAFQRGQDIQRSIDELHTAVALNHLNDAYVRNLAQALLVKAGNLLSGGQPDRETSKAIHALVEEAVRVAKEATVLAPANVDNWANLASVYQSITSLTPGADELAIQGFRDALIREPNNPVYLNEVGKMYVLRSDAHRTLLSSPDAKARAAAEANVKQELEKAAEYFNQSITVKADYAEAHFNLGLVYERQGRMHDAVAKLEQVLRANPQNVGVAFQLATLYYRVGDKESSRTLHEQIVQAQPSYANARWYLAAIYEEQGMYEEAIAQLEQVLRLNPGNTAVTQKLTEIRNKQTENAKPTRNAPLPAPLKEVISSP
jgi:tetratricopeptide (TPR) repeat protein